MYFMCRVNIWWTPTFRSNWTSARLYVGVFICVDELRRLPDFHVIYNLSN